MKAIYQRVQQLKTSQKLMGLLTALLVVIAILIFTITSHHHRQHAQQLAKKAEQQYQQLINSTAPLTFDRLLTVINNASQAKTDFGNDNKKLNDIIQVSVHKLFLPLLANRFEDAIAKNLKNQRLLYSLLNAYLMLGSAKTLDANKILHIAQYIEPDAREAVFKQSFHSATKPPFQGLALQQGLVSAARDSINSLPIDQQAFLVLANENLQSKTLLDHLKWFTPNALQVPSIYTRKALQQAMNSLVPTAVNSVLFGNLTLGDRQNSKLNPNDLSKLVYTDYLQQYSDYWSKVIGWLHLNNAKTIDQLQKMLANFAGNQSELNKVLDVIHNNTDLPQIAVLNKSLAQFNTLYQQSAQALLAMKLKLGNVSHTIHQQSTQQRINWVRQQIEIGNYNPITMSIALPSPLNDWLKNLSTQYWQLSVNAVTNSINQAWQQKIVAFYKQHFFEHFPFAANEFPDTDITAFNQFFKPHGILQQFLKNDVGNFLQRNGGQWQWNRFPGFATQTNSALKTLQTLNIVSTKWYSNKQSPKLSFNLTPIFIAKTIKQTVININGNLLVTNFSTLNKGSNFTWQFGEKDKASVTFLDAHNQIATEKQQGPWAWLRLLANNQLVDNNDESVVKFTIGTLQADYDIKPSQAYNAAFAKQLMNTELPARLLKQG